MRRKAPQILRKHQVQTDFKPANKASPQESRPNTENFTKFLERCGRLISSRSPFTAKLHGSISSIESVVFAESDYVSIKSDKSYIAAVKNIFYNSTVVFLGYGIRDEYVIDLLQQDSEEQDLFGNGPHFLITPDNTAEQNGFRRICYDLRRFPDHRAALTVLDIITQEQRRGASSEPQAHQEVSSRDESGFYISEFHPPGTHESGQTFQFGDEGGVRGAAVIGLGWTQNDLPSNETFALHDLLVGLLCFDRVYLPLAASYAFHNFMPQVFWNLVQRCAVRFIHIPHQPTVIFLPGSVLGNLGLVTKQGAVSLQLETAIEAVSRAFQAIPGLEAVAEPQIESLGKQTLLFDDSPALDLPGVVRGAVLMPRVAGLLGFSEAIMPSNVPRWLSHPVLRLAHLVQTAMICDRFKIRAARVGFGGISLLSAAFSVDTSKDTAYELASYALTGSYGTNLTAFIVSNPSIFDTALKFRESQEGMAFRREVADKLKTNEGLEFSAATDAGLARMISTETLQKARTKMISLMTTANLEAPVAALWTDPHINDHHLRYWRRRSRELLWESAKQLGCDSNSPCICGSGDTLRLCCLQALTE